MEKMSILYLLPSSDVLGFVTFGQIRIVGFSIRASPSLGIPAASANKEFSAIVWVGVSWMRQWGCIRIAGTCFACRIWAGETFWEENLWKKIVDITFNLSNWEDDAELSFGLMFYLFWVFRSLFVRRPWARRRLPAGLFRRRKSNLKLMIKINIFALEIRNGKRNIFILIVEHIT